MGKRLGRFRLISLLGKGAMGKVFRAHDTTLDRHVALKTLPKVFKTGTCEIGAEQLIREARSAATIEHPHVVQIFEAGEHKGVHYIAMELLEGGTLHELVKAVGQMDAVRACQLVAEAAEGLEHAHSLGIVHRDIKPSNLMLTRGGRCKVVDFGLARVETASGKFIPLGESVGTPQFLAPEVIQGAPATPRSDVYSLGATLWFLLAGRAPFAADSKVKLLQMQVSAALPDLRQIRTDLPEGLVLALARAMAKRPEDRFESAGQFAKALRVHTIPVGAASGSGLSTFAQASGMLRPLERQAARTAWSPNRAPVLATAGGALVVLLLGLMIYWTRPPAPATAGNVTATNTATPGAPERSPPPAPPAESAVRTASAQSAGPVAAALIPVAADAPPTVTATPPPPPVPSLKPAPPPAVSSAVPSDQLPSVIDVSQLDLLKNIALGADARYPNREATVQGVVKSAAVSGTGKVCRVTFEGVGRDGFAAVYFPDQFKVMEQAFGGTAGAALGGRRVRIKGRVEMFQDKPQIRVERPGQIEVVR